MRSLKFFSVLMLGICVSVGIYAQSADDVLAKIKDNQAKIKTLQTSYVQTTKFDLIGKDPIEERGVLYQKDRKIRKEIQSPDKKLVIQTPDFYYEKDDKTQQEKKTVYSEISANSNMPNFSMMTPDEALAKYSFSITQETDQFYILSGSYEQTRIDMTVDKGLYTISKMEIYSQNKLILTIKNEYVDLNGLKVLSKMQTQSHITIGKNTFDLSVSTVYLKPEINKDISDQVFTATVRK